MIFWSCLVVAVLAIVFIAGYCSLSLLVTAWVCIIFTLVVVAIKGTLEVVVDDLFSKMVGGANTTDMRMRMRMRK